MTQSISTIVRSEVKRVIDAYHYPPQEVPVLLQAIREARTDDETVLLARAFLVRHSGHNAPEYILARKGIEAALAAWDLPQNVDEALTIAERPVDTPALDTSMHDIHINLDEDVDFPKFVVTIEVSVIDASLAIAEAVSRCDTDRVDRSTITSLSDAVHYLLDPGESPTGLQIEHSSIEAASDVDEP